MYTAVFAIGSCIAVEFQGATCSQRPMDAVFRRAETGDATALHEVQELQRDLFEHGKAARAHASELQTDGPLYAPLAICLDPVD